MLKHLITSLLAGQMLFVCSFAYAQNPEPVFDREIYLGAGLTKPSSGKALFQPRVLYKVKRNEKWIRRYSFMVDFETDRLDRIRPEEFSRAQNQNSTFSSAFGLGAEKRVAIGQLLAFYYGGEMALVMSIDYDGRTSYINYTNGIYEQTRTDKVTYYRPGLAFNAIVGLRCDPIPRLSLSIEAGPGVQSVLAIESTLDRTVTNPGTPTEVTDEYSSLDFDWSNTLRVIGPVFIQVGYKF